MFSPFPPLPFLKGISIEEKAAAFWKGNSFLAFPLPMSSAFMMARERCVWIYKKHSQNRPRLISLWRNVMGRLPALRSQYPFGSQYAQKC